MCLYIIATHVELNYEKYSNKVLLVEMNKTLDNDL